jgi:6-pyruvoyltetrahydropterin/6-carboxytetrahydropterin synthase
MYEVYVAAQFEAAHRLVGDFGPATRTHGHTYRMEVIVRGEGLSDDGTLYDIGELRSAVEDLASSLHYRDLDEVPELAGVNTTAEAVAGYCWEKLAPPLRGRDLDSLVVRIWESPQVYAAREEGLTNR